MSHLSGVKRARHFHHGPDQAAATAAAAEVGPASTIASPPTNANEPRLYRHAIESIIAFLCVRELAVVSTVDREWNRAIATMRPVSQSVTLNAAAFSLVDMIESPLARHVGKISSNDPLSPVQLYAMCARLSGLHTLKCMFAQTHFIGNDPRLPASLTALDVRFSSTMKLACINNLLRTASRLAHIRMICVDAVYISFSDIDFSCFATTFSLRTLEMYYSMDEWTPLQIAQIRAIPLLEDIGTSMRVERDLPVLLRSPHTLHLTHLCVHGSVGVLLAELLTNLPTLTHLTVEFDAHKECSLAFLGSIPTVTHLQLDYGNTNPLLPPIGQVAFPDVMCVRMRRLEVCFADGVLSAHLAGLLAYMPQLSELVLVSCSTLETLRFLVESGQLTHTLRVLHINRCAKLQATDLHFVGAMKQLDDLEIACPFVGELDSWSKSQFVIPSLLLPKLSRAKLTGRS